MSIKKITVFSGLILVALVGAYLIFDSLGISDGTSEPPIGTKDQRPSQPKQSIVASDGSEISPDKDLISIKHLT